MEKLRLREIIRSIKIVRSITSLVLAVSLCILCVGCGKTGREEKTVEEQLDVYKIYAEKSLDYIASNAVVIDNVVYGCYTKDAYKENTKTTYGLFQYDIDTKNSEELDLQPEVQKIQNMYVDEDNHLVVSVLMNESGISDNQNKAYTYIYNTDFELLSKNEETSDRMTDSSNEVNYVYICGDRIVKVFEISDRTHNIIIEDQSGNEVEKIELEDRYLKGFFKTEGSTFAVLTSDDSGYNLYKLSLSSEKKNASLEEVLEINHLDNVSIYPKNENEILIDSDGYLNVCDMNTGKLVKILKYIDCGIDSRKVDYVYEIDEDSYALFLYNTESFHSQINLITNKEVVQEKKELYLATMLNNSSLENKVIAFNNSNDEYKLVIKEYLAGYPTKEEADKAIEQFNLDILAGDCADIIDLESYIDIKRYADKGVFEDLSPYLERDSEISEEDFIENALEACRINGTLYTLSDSFSIDVLAGAKSRIGEESAWTVDEFINYVNRLPEGVEIMAGLTCEHLLRKMIGYNFDEFIDWNKSKCTFNSDEFIEILEFCGRYMTNEEYSEYLQNNEIASRYDISAIRNHQIELYETGIKNIGDYLIINEIFGEDVTIKGYPTSKGTGIGISLNGSAHFAINSKSGYKEAAWNFIKQFFTYEEQRSVSDFPMIKDALDDKLEGEKTRELNLFLPKAPDGTEYYQAITDGNIELYVERPTDEDIKRMKEIISLAGESSENYSSEIYSIIEEEAESYFAGQRSAEEVADVIQSRVSIYVNEKH